MKTLALFLLLSLPCFAGERWFELRVSALHSVTNYAVPAGRIVELKGFDTTADSLTFTIERTEGKIIEAPSNNSVNGPSGSFVMGPAKLKLTWTGQVDARYGFHSVLFREFDAETPSPVVNVTLTASTNLPDFKPAAAFFQAVPSP